MTALPFSPGIVPYLYQPTSVKFDGDAILLEVVIPTRCTAALMLSEGISNRAGKSPDVPEVIEAEPAGSTASVSGAYQSACTSVVPKTASATTMMSTTAVLNIVLRVI